MPAQLTVLVDGASVVFIRELTTVNIEVFIDDNSCEYVLAMGPARKTNQLTTVERSTKEYIRCNHTGLLTFFDDIRLVVGLQHRGEDVKHASI